MILRRLKSWSTVSFSNPVTNTLFAFWSALRNSSKSFFLSSLFFTSDSRLRLCQRFFRRQLGHIDLDARAHARAQRRAPYILALGGGRLRFQDCRDQARSVFNQFDRRETGLADGRVDDPGLVDPELH